MQALAPSLLDALPQTQCQRCGYPDCAAYAQAIADDAAPINQCPPGGAEGIARLAALTGRPRLPLNPAFGIEAPRQMAFIDEQWCIGCTLCLQACPTDAIVGSHKLMHTVIEMHCTGCELCIPVCPVDCIELEPASGDLTGWSAWSPEQASQARNRYASHSARVGIAVGAAAVDEAVRSPVTGLPDTIADPASASPPDMASSPVSGTVAAIAPQVKPSGPDDAASARRTVIAAALAAARIRRGQPPTG